MLRLDSTLRKLQIVLAGAITTNQLPVVVCFSDKTSTTYNGGTTVSNTNSTTAVDICAAPGASTIRDIDSITVQNADTAAATVTIRYNDNGTNYSLLKCTLSVGDQLIYTHGQGWKVLDSSGAMKALSSDTVTLTGAQTLSNKTILAAGPNTVEATSAPNTSAFSWRNKIQNSNFAINQRKVTGTVTLSAGAYGHDRWKAGASGCTYTFAISNNVTTITISAGSLLQVIEGVNLLDGTHVLSWTGTAQGRIDSGSYSASGVTGTAVGGTNQSIEFNTGTVSKVQYEPGAIVTPYSGPSIDADLAICQYYLPALNASSTTSAISQGFAVSGSTTVANVAFPVQVRTPPTGIVISAASHVQVDIGAGSVAATAVTIGGAKSHTMCSVLISAATGASAGLAGQVYFNNASGQLLFTGGEL